MLNGCASLKFLSDISKWNTNYLKDISYIFYRCSSLVSIPDLSQWNKNNVYDMNSFIEDCFIINIIT